MVYPWVTKILFSRSSKMQVKLRLPQFAQGCWPEHLIFCLRHLEQLRNCQQGNRNDHARRAYAFDDLFVTLLCSFEVAITAEVKVCHSATALKGTSIR